MNQKGFATIILVVILVTLFIGGIVYFKGREPFEQQRLAPNSSAIPLEVKKGTKAASDLELVWNKNSQMASFKVPGLKTLEFKLIEEPKKAVIYKPNSTLAIVTASDKSPDNLYIYQDNKITKVDQGTSSKIGTSNDISYSRFDDFSFSPDGNYLFYNTAYYEISSAQIIDLKTNKKILDSADPPPPFGSVFFHPIQQCALSFNGFGMWGPSIYYAKMVNNRYKFNRFEEVDFGNRKGAINSFELDKTQVFWEKDCSGIIFVVDEKDNGSWYQFNMERNKLESSNVSPEQLGFKENVKADRDNILLVIEK